MADKDFEAAARRLWEKLEKDLAASPFAASLKTLAAAQDRLKGGRARPAEHRRHLAALGMVWGEGTMGGVDRGAGLETVRGNWFERDVLLAGFRGEWPGPGGRTWPAGMAGCRVRDAIVGSASLYRVDRIDRQVIEDGAILAGVGELDCPAPTTFGLGLAVHPGSEAGTRSLWLWDGIDLDDCAEAASLPRGAQQDFAAKLERLLSPYRCRFGFVGRGAAVTQTRRVIAAWIGPGSVVAGASLVREAALLSAEGAPCSVGDDAWVDQAMLQAGSRVASGGKVSRSLLLRNAEVSWGGMASQSVIGSHTQVGKGEVTASIVGPFVGLHHQSLLISALWPEGVGNIAYGANVGSNHTGKKPDQEIRPGEGTFFGLGCVVKFPANFEDAPYSLVAAGLTTLPQRLRFPFSLLNQPQAPIPGLSPALNEILPGWVWSDNAYSLVRRSYKLLDADKARRDAPTDPASPGFPGTALAPGFFTGPLFRPAMARRALSALAALRAAPEGKPCYLEEDIPGLGKNVLRGDKRAAAIAAYEDFLVFFLFRAYADRPDIWGAEAKELVPAVAAAVRGATTGNPESEAGAGSATSGDIHRTTKSFLAGELKRLRGFRDTLHKSLGRDDKRGRQVFEDYADFHDAPESDSTVGRLEDEAEALQAILELSLRNSPALPA